MLPLVLLEQPRRAHELTLTLLAPPPPRSVNGTAPRSTPTSPRPRLATTPSSRTKSLPCTPRTSTCVLLSPSLPPAALRPTRAASRAERQLTSLPLSARPQAKAVAQQHGPSDPANDATQGKPHTHGEHDPVAALQEDVESK